MATSVSLINGETVSMEIDRVCNQDQVFIRIGPKLIAGIVIDKTWQGIYIWKLVIDTYKYLGDIAFNTKDNEVVQWSVCPNCCHLTKEDQKQFYKHFRANNSLFFQENIISNLVFLSKID